MLVQIQNLQRLAGGGSAYIYAVNDEIVLKAPVTFVEPEQGSSPETEYEYAVNTVCCYEDIENERSILKIIQEVPNPNIVQAVSLEYPEGIYLQKCIPLSERLHTEEPSDSIKASWYRDMLSALIHLHTLGIAHADVRLDNFLYHVEGRTVLCDFTCSRPFGDDNPSAGTRPGSISVNGAARTVSGVTDIFALASVIFEIETGTKPDIGFSNDSISFPDVRTGNHILDSILEKAWLAEYPCTKDMLKDVESLSHPGTTEIAPHRRSVAIEDLQCQVRSFRSIQENKHGSKSSNGRLV